MFKCDKCSKEFKSKQGLNSHIGWHNKPSTERSLKTGEDHWGFGKKGTNQFIKAKEEGRVIIISEETRKKIGKSGANREWTKEQREVHSIAMKKVVKLHPESYSTSNVSGRVKNIEYNGFTLKGSWELEVAKWLDGQNISWTNKVAGFDYLWDGSMHTYFPDFYLPEYDKYIEVKGYERARDLEKWKVVDNLILIKHKEINKIKKGISLKIFR